MIKFDYTFHKNRDWKYYEIYLKRFKSNPSPILEMGSGLGLFLEACKNNNIEATGLEYEIEGVMNTKSKGLVAMQHDLSEPVPFLNETFSAVFSNQVIEHLKPATQKLMISEAYRVLKPGGQVLIQSPCKHFEAARLDKYHISLLAPTELKRMMELVGFVRCNLSYNRMQTIQGVPDSEIETLWKRYKPDAFSKDATVFAYKPE